MTTLTGTVEITEDELLTICVALRTYAELIDHNPLIRADPQVAREIAARINLAQVITIDA